MTTIERTPGPLGPIAIALAAIALLPGACKDDPTPGSDGASSNGNPSTGSDSADSVELLCTPGEVQCNGQGFLDTCAPTGLEWLTEPCGTNEVCRPCDEDDTCAEDFCIGPCEVEAELPSSAGCSFIANRQLHPFPGESDGLVVSNPNTELDATIQLFQTPEGERKEDPVGDPIVLAPGEETLFELDASFVLGESSMFRTGGTYRVQSDAPVIAYQHSPLSTGGNDSSMLLPETTLRRDYVVASYAPHEEQGENLGEPSYFEIVALEDFTVVQWTPPVDTAGTGLNIDFVSAGETSAELHMNRFDTVRVAASANFQMDADLRDVSGTVIHATKPIWVMGASRCSRVPVREFPELGRCDPLQELLIPLDYWGERYVAPHSPTRGNELNYWRVYSASPGVRITAEGNLGCTAEVITADNCTAPNEFDGTGCTLAARGSWVELVVENECSFFLDSNNTGAFLPVGYVQSSRHNNDEPAETAAEDGDPSMYQMVPVEQFLSRYVFSTGKNFDFHYAQVIREVGGPSVFLDNESVTGFYPVTPTYEVADVLIDKGAHVIESGVPFGVVQFGYSSGGPSDLCTHPIDGGDVCHASYAYPGGMKSERINIP
ncbi:MAG: IgGFc-binding protein [Deltaproteobacteria bacterium]|nr:IgGFc-binding protein [Deltaproteobacteria bacterium]